MHHFYKYFPPIFALIYKLFVNLWIILQIICKFGLQEMCRLALRISSGSRVPSSVA